jgi:hypothetical protein
MFFASAIRSNEFVRREDARLDALALHIQYATGLCDLDRLIPRRSLWIATPPSLSGLVYRYVYF